MGAPKRLRVDVGDTSLSAFILPEMAIDDVTHIVCKECAPAQTKMRLSAEVTVMKRSGNQHYAVLTCGRCRRQWAVPYALDTVARDGQ